MRHIFSSNPSLFRSKDRELKSWLQWITNFHIVIGYKGATELGRGKIESRCCCSRSSRCGGGGSHDEIEREERIEFWRQGPREQSEEAARSGRGEWRESERSVKHKGPSTI